MENKQLQIYSHPDWFDCDLYLMKITKYYYFFQLQGGYVMRKHERNVRFKPLNKRR